MVKNYFINQRNENALNFPDSFFNTIRFFPDNKKPVTVNNLVKLQPGRAGFLPAFTKNIHRFVILLFVFMLFSQGARAYDDGNWSVTADECGNIEIKLEIVREYESGTVTYAMDNHLSFYEKIEGDDSQGIFFIYNNGNPYDYEINDDLGVEIVPDYEGTVKNISLDSEEKSSLLLGPYT
ncbi:MAG: hypothetical protein GVY19_08130 [Bacteroidetes bacterium]|jgi:hypothetical protein|nr:hypothetical protein [Bacteroidota bacterium]